METSHDLPDRDSPNLSLSNCFSVSARKISSLRLNDADLETRVVLVALEMNRDWFGGYFAQMGLLKICSTLAFSDGRRL